ncbi:protein kinase [Nonomuraea mangrovi]|uniref:non-specific serine/threonine protein kinase n=1 Tax=Nonomuraea mangrovi TaxID=2316207 RepID=A0ABW4SXA6_9ACTN
MTTQQPVLVAGRYELIDQIGRGGMAEVWRGHDRKRNLSVAVKILDPLAGGITAAERFAREARAAAQVIHPNVVNVLDVGADEYRRFLVMQLLTGRSLAAELVRRGRFDVAEACHLLAQAAAGLHAAHEVGVVHRDIKPANLHLTADGTIKVVDFGLAHIATEAARLTTVGTIIGTPAYLAPEQIDGSGGMNTTDLYALGCVAYELLCGQPPFSGSPAELVYQHIHRSPVQPGAHRPGLPAELERLILAMLAKDPAARPASADQVRQILLSVVHTAQAGGRHAGSPAQAAPVPPPAGMTRVADTAVLFTPLPRPGSARTSPANSQRLLIQLAAALAAIALVTFGAVALFSGSGQQAAPPSSSPAAVTAEPRQPTSAAAPTKPMPRPTRRPSAAPTPPPQGPRTWLAAFDRAITAQQANGGIDAKLADKAHRKIRDAARKLAQGKAGEAREKIQELGRDLAKAQRQGKLTDGPLTGFLDRSGLG